MYRSMESHLSPEEEKMGKDKVTDQFEVNIGTTTWVTISSKEYDDLPQILREIASYVEQGAVTIEDIAIAWEEGGVYVTIHVDASDHDALAYFSSRFSNVSFYGVPLSEA